MISLERCRELSLRSSLLDILKTYYFGDNSKVMNPVIYININECFVYKEERNEGKKELSLDLI